MKLKNVTRLMLYAFVIACIAPSCVKEGPLGLTGPAGLDGKDGADANETCKMCHTPAKVDLIAVQFELSKHSFGEAATSEAGALNCAVCHTEMGFKYVVKNNVSTVFTLDATTGKYVNPYVTIATDAYGTLSCGACHSAIHATYGSSDLPSLTTVAPVPLTMWGGKKTMDLKADGGKSNLCVKCHQPRPFTNALTGNVLDYVALATTTGVVYDGNPTGTTNIIKPSYRTHTHYGAVGAVYAGMGGVEFSGMPYTNSTHTQAASCSDCHMGPMNGKAGGHTFSAIANFTTCNVTGCHTTAITSTNSTYWVNPRNEIKTLLASLAAKLTVGGVEIMNRNGDSASNLWYGITANNYDGYLNVYDPITNPDGQKYNASSFKYVGTPSATTWSAAQIAYNATLPTLTLSNAQMGALINFQLCLRDYSLGIHNFAYTKALLTNTIAKL